MKRINIVIKQTIIIFSNLRCWSIREKLLSSVYRSRRCSQLSSYPCFSFIQVKVMHIFRCFWKIKLLWTTISISTIIIEQLKIRNSLRLCSPKILFCFVFLFFCFLFVFVFCFLFFIFLFFCFVLFFFFLFFFFLGGGCL